SENSRENRLTPFHSDPVTEGSTEAIYFRDEENGRIWGATPGPTPRDEGAGPWVITQGAGQTRFAHAAHGVSHSLSVFVDQREPVKFSWLTITNQTRRERKLSVYSYQEWSLGPPRPGRGEIFTEFDSEARAVLARNPSHAEFPQKVAFACA